MLNNQWHFFVMEQSFKRAIKSALGKQNEYNNPYCQLNLSMLQTIPLKSFCTSKSAATFICEKGLHWTSPHIHWKLVISVTSESAILSVCQWAKLRILKWCLSIDSSPKLLLTELHIETIHIKRELWPISRCLAIISAVFNKIISSFKSKEFSEFQVLKNTGIFKLKFKKGVRGKE